MKSRTEMPSRVQLHILQYRDIKLNGHSTERCSVLVNMCVHLYLKYIMCMPKNDRKKYEKWPQWRQSVSTFPQEFQ